MENHSYARRNKKQRIIRFKNNTQKKIAIWQNVFPMFKEDLRKCTVIAQLCNSFIICKVKNNIVCFDQHAVHERIRLEKIFLSLPRTLRFHDLKRPERVHVRHGDVCAFRLHFTSVE